MVVIVDNLTWKTKSHNLSCIRNYMDVDELMTQEDRRDISQTGVHKKIIRSLVKIWRILFIETGNNPLPKPMIIINMTDISQCATTTNIC